MLLFHKLSMLYLAGRGPLQTFTCEAPDGTITSVNMGDKFKYYSQSDVQCFVLGDLMKYDNKDFQPLTDYLNNAGIDRYVPFPLMAVHYTLESGQKYVTVLEELDKFTNCPSATTFVERDGQIFSHDTVLAISGYTVNDSRKIQRQFISTAQRCLEYGLLFNKFATEKPTFEGMTRQQRRHLGFKNISDVVHIYPEQAKRKSYAVDCLGVRPELTHRFDRSGHFRRIKGVGKDQTGTYGVQGMTWVRNTVVGPEDKPYVPKTRVIHTTQQEDSHGHQPKNS